MIPGLGSFVDMLESLFGRSYVITGFIPVLIPALLGLLLFGLGMAVSFTRQATDTASGFSTDPTDRLYKMVRAKKVIMRTRTEMLDLVVVEGKAKGIIARNLITGEIQRYAADAVVLATGGYSRVFRLSTLAIGCNGSAIWKAHKRGAPPIAA